MSESTTPLAIRETLFGDMPMTSWPGAGMASELEPWKSFAEARSQLDHSEIEAAKQTLQRILSEPDLESRHYLQAWHFLRGLGEPPSADEAKKLFGVVVEVALDEGLDVVAAYADHTARYFNYSGAAVIWDRPNSSLDSVIDRLLEAGRVIVEKIGPWEQPRPPAPVAGYARINLLVPEGLNFGEGPFANLANDQLGGPVISTAMNLMQALIALPNGDGAR